MSGLAKSMADLGHNVTIIVQNKMSESRESQGWEVPDIGTANLVLISNEQDVYKLIANSTNNTRHLCQGLRANGLISLAQNILRKHKARQIIIMETVDDRGWSGILKRLYYWLYFKRFSRDISSILAIGANTKEWLVHRGVDRHKIVPFAYFLPRIDMTIERKKNVGFKLLYVGQLINRKRLDLLINAISLIPNDSLELMVIGSGKLEIELKNYAEKLLPNRVHWIGKLPINKVRYQMAQSDCLVLPSQHDGWGAVTIESLLSGTPVICSDACGSSVAVKLSGHGGVFKSCDVDSLKQLIEDQISAKSQQLCDSGALSEWACCFDIYSGAMYLSEILMSENINRLESILPPWERGKDNLS